MVDIFFVILASGVMLYTLLRPPNRGGPVKRTVNSIDNRDREDKKEVNSNV